MNINPNITKGLEHLRAAYPGTVYVGGSFARHYIMPEFAYNDVDVFILGTRRSEVWVTHALMQSLFDDAENMIKYDTELFDDNGESTNPLYKLEHQHGRFVCKMGDVVFDVIFLDDSIDNLITNQTASSLSKFHLEVTYDPTEMLHVYDHKDTRKAVGDLKIGQVCEIQSGKGTKSHIQKIEQVCRKHHIRIKRIPENHGDWLQQLSDCEVGGESE